MVSRTTIGKSFDGLVRYQYTGRRDQPADKQAEILASSGVSTESAAEMISDFNLGKAVNPRLGYPVWHTSLSFNPDDAARLDSAKMLAIAEGYLQKMGLDKTQYVVVRHHDQPDNQHLHLIANRVGYDGKTIDDGRNFYRSKLALQELIAEHELTPTKGQRPELQHPERLRGTDLARQKMLTTVNQAMDAETKRPHLLAALRAAGIGIEERFDKAGKATGISFEKDGYKFKGSELGRHFSSAGIDKQLAANELKQQAAVSLEITTASLPLASIDLGTGSGITPTSSEKAELVKLPEVATEQPPVVVKTLAATLARENAAGGENSAVAQPDTTGQDRLMKQAVAVVAAFQREKELLATYREQANRAYQEKDFTRFAELEYETIPAAKERLATYEAIAKTNSFGSELLAKNKDRDIDKVQKEVSPLVEENSTISVPISRQQLVISPAVESVSPAPSADSLLTSPAILSTPLVSLPLQQLPVVPVVVEERLATKVPLETTPPVVPRQVVAAQAETIITSPPPTATPGVSKQLLPSASTGLTPAPDPAAGPIPPAAAPAQKSQPAVPVIAAPAKPPVASVGPTEGKPPVGLTYPATSAANRLPLGPAVPAVPTVVGPPIAQPPQSPEKVAQQLPAMSLAEKLITALPDRPATTVVAIPVIVTAPVVSEVAEAAWQHGIIRMQATEKRTSEERLNAVRTALLAAGATVGELVPPIPGRHEVPLLPYSFDPATTSLAKINQVLEEVQTAGNSKVQEQQHPLHQPASAPKADNVQWPDREGQFNQAHVLIDDSTAGPARANKIANALRSVGASVGEIQRDEQGLVTMQVSYHTHAPRIDAINNVLESVNNSSGIEVQESKQNKDARYMGAVQVGIKQAQASAGNEQGI